MTKEMHISSKEIALYHQSEVTRSRAQEIEMHLAGCSLCRQKLERFCRIVNALSEPDEEIVGLDLGADVQRSVRALPPAISRSRRLWPLFAGVAAASLLVLVTVILFRYQESSGTLENCRDFRAKSAKTA
jgi:anti-sigma factor RsiW